jgi:methylglyoxal synthase
VENVTIPLPARKRIALVAHDNMKAGLYDWVRYNLDTLRGHTLFATGTTGGILELELGLSVTRLESGPLGGDQQIGAMISRHELDFLIFFWDPLEQLPHDPDVRALLRLVNVWNIPVACNRSSADFLISSPLMGEIYPRQVPDYSAYRSRRIRQAGVV